QLAEGSPMWVAPRFVFLDDVTQSPLRMQGMLYDRLHNVNFKVRESGTYNTFPLVRDGAAEHFLDGHVVRIDQWKLFYYTELAVPESASGSGNVSRPEKSKLEKLVADKVVGADDAKRVVRYDEGYWEKQIETKVVKAGFDRNRFTVELDRDSDTPVTEDDGQAGALDAPPKGNPVDVLRGKVIHREDGYVYVLPEERYYELRLGESIDDSLQRKPLSSEVVKKLKDYAANN
ncbi:MAG TPA: hypothetical protein VFW33_16185, partial [Gemmataceae bacterium]|nr:hypothetical protein [Gemmataceae bacterium]